MSPDPRRQRKPWSQPLADILAPHLAASFSHFGFDDARLLLFWPEIVGARLARRCEPLKLQWPPRRSFSDVREAATLIVRVDGAFAIELQHQAPTVIERVNAHVGWRCVGRLALRQAPSRTPVAHREVVPSPGPASVAEARVAAELVGDEGLREALVRLGARVIDSTRRST